MCSMCVLGGGAVMKWHQPFGEGESSNNVED